MRKSLLLSVLLLTASIAVAQPSFDKPHGLYDEAAITVTITASNPGCEIHYTTDGSQPTAASSRYTCPLTFTTTTLLRAVEVEGDSVCTPVTTATYLFTESVLALTGIPAGYPDTWGQYTTIDGTAPADYEMDPEMTGDARLRPAIIRGLKSLPVLSIVTDKGHLFSHENDTLRGGIYIFTGPPVGDATGHGWTRPANVELFGDGGDGFSISCGLRLHGGHGRLAEKNPKHSFRLVFKERYGAKNLKYPLFPDDGEQKYQQLVLRCHFGNAWQHWGEGNRKKAQYTRDVWARRMQRKMGHNSVNARYVNLFLNGMYWGLYNIAERVDNQYGKDHLGGQKSDIDVVKIEEDGGYHIEAAEGDLEVWQLMTETAAKASDDTYYYLLEGKDGEGNDDPEQEALLDIDNFIDYMLINQYGGNTDWDHHNWYALRRRGTDSQGFRFLCWDSEIILENERENVIGKNNGSRFPTGIFHNLMQNPKFARRYLHRANELLADDGLLGQASVVATWDSLYHTIADALYDEAARWGDYRRDVHQWQTAGQLYTVDDTYQAERNRLLNSYFPVRSGNVLNAIQSIVTVDDFEAPDTWIPLAASMFREWDGTGADAQPVDRAVSVDWNFNTSAGGGTAIAGFVNVDHNQFADLSVYDKLVLRGAGGTLRILANRLTAHGPYKQLNVALRANDPRWDSSIGGAVINLSDLQTMPTNEGKERIDDFVHLNVIKVDWSSNVNVTSAWLIPKAQDTHMAGISVHSTHPEAFYNLNGQRVAHPTKGLYVVDGKKMLKK